MTDAGMAALRERLIQCMADYWHIDGSNPKSTAVDIVDAILAELAAAGYVPMERERLRGLITLGHIVAHMNQARTSAQVVEMGGEAAHFAYVLEARGFLDPLPEPQP